MRSLFFRLFVVLIIGLCYLLPVHATDDNVIPILENELKTTKGKDKFYLLFELSELNAGLSIDQSIYYADSALKIAIEIKDKVLEAKAMENIGNINLLRQEWSEAINYFTKAKDIYKEQKSGKLIIDIIFKVSDIYLRVNDFDKSQKYLQEGIQFVSDSATLACFNTKFGYLFYKSNNFDTALTFYNKSYSYYNKNHFYFKKIEVIQNLGMLYNDWGKYDESLVCYKESYVLYKKLQDEIGEIISFYKIAEVFFNYDKLDSSEFYLHKAIKLSEKWKQREYLSHSYLLLGKIKKNKLLWNQALDNFNKSVTIARDINNNNDIIENYDNIYQVYYELKDYKNAFENYKNLNTYKEFFLGANDQVSEMNTQYAIEKNEQQITLLNKEAELQSIKEKRRKNTILILIFGFALLLGIIGLVYRQSVQRKRTNEILEQQKNEILKINEELKQQAEEILTQKEMLQEAFKTIEQTNLELMDNIRYAQRIQGSILPQEVYITKVIPDHFIFFQPKDILSGDFYWVQDYSLRQSTTADTDHVLVAAVDCTGHGVSGALLSIVGNNLLNQALFEHHLSKPSDILKFMHGQVFNIWELSQVETEIRVHDGMDMALINIDRKKMLLQYAGAKNPIYIVRNNELTIYKATKQAIGETSSIEVQFVNNEISIQSGDLVYLFSDGYADQFGGDRNKKFKDSQFIKMLTSISNKPMSEQKVIVHNTFEEWKGPYEQVDDVLVIGIRI